MEYGKEVAFELDQIQEEDLKARLNAVIVFRATFKDCVALRNFLDTCGSYNLIHFSMSGEHIYAAKRHELTPEKQRDLGIAR